MAEAAGRSGLSSLLWAGFEQFAMVAGLSALAALCLLWAPLALLLHPLLPQRWGTWLGRRVISGAFRTYLGFLHFVCGCRFDLDELDRIDPRGPLIIAGNHPSLLDAVVLISRQTNAVCVMKAALMRNLLFGPAARLARYIRGDSLEPLLASARDELERGAHLVIFPEGTRTRRFPVDECSPFTGLIARSAAAPVQAVLIEYSTPYLGKAWGLWRRPRLPLYCRVRLGKRFAPVADVRAFTRELKAHFEGELAARDFSPARSTCEASRSSAGA